MANEVYVYPGDEAYRTDQVTATKEITWKSTEAAEKIHFLYDSGTPFYTKAAIRDVWQQLEKASVEGQKVWVRGLDGVIVAFDIECGRTIQAPQHDLEFHNVRLLFPLLFMPTLLGSSAQRSDEVIENCHSFITSLFNSLRQVPKTLSLVWRIVIYGYTII